MPKGVPSRRYTAEFKTKTVETMCVEGPSYSEAGRRFGVGAHTLLQIWERIYLAEGRKYVPKKIAGPDFERRATSAQKVRTVQELRQEFPLKVLLSVAWPPRSTFYYEVKRMGRPDKYKAVKTEMQKIFTEHRGRYARTSPGP